MKKRPELSCIIITLNEERHLPELLDSLNEQTFQNFEIIVADFNSIDKTREIARKYGCKIVRGGKQSIARNNGAKIAKGRYLVFLDADGILKDKKFLEENLKRFKETGAGISSVYVKPHEGKFADYILFTLYALWMFCLQKISPYGTGACIFVRKEVFKKVRGFNEKVVFAEDHELICRARKYKYIILPCPIYTSVRRLHHDGRIKTSIRYLYVFVYRTFYKEVDCHLFDYEKRD